MFSSTSMVSKSIVKSNSKSNSAFGAKSKAKAVAFALRAEVATNHQIHAASLRATATAQAKEVFVARTHLQLFLQKLTDVMNDAESKALLHRLYAEAAAESTQMGMGLELHAFAAPAPAATATATCVDYDDDDACSDSDDEAPPPPSAASTSKAKSKPAKGKGSGTQRPEQRGKKSGWNLYRQAIAAKAPPAAFVARDEALTPEKRAEKTDAGKPAHPPWTKEGGSKHTDAGILEAWKHGVTDEERASWNARAAEEWAALVASRAAAVADGTADLVEVNCVDFSLLPAPTMSRHRGGKAAKSASRSKAPERQAESAAESDDNDAPPAPKPKPKSKPKSKRSADEMDLAPESAVAEEEPEEEAVEEEAEEEAEEAEEEAEEAVEEEAEEEAEEAVEEAPAPAPAAKRATRARRGRAATAAEEASDPTTVEDLFGAEQ